MKTKEKIKQEKIRYYITLGFGIWIMFWGIFTAVMFIGVAENIWYGDELNFDEMLGKQQQAIEYQQSALMGFVMMLVGCIPIWAFHNTKEPENEIK